MVRVILVESMPLIRAALAELLRRERDIEIVAAVAGCDPVVPLSDEPDVAVIDIDALRQTDIMVTRALHERFPECRIIILATVETPRDVKRALAIDAHGHLAKDVPPQHLAESIRLVAHGATVTAVGEPLRTLRPAESPLTHREQEILRLAADGAPACEIAHRLSLAVGTVRNYLSAIVAKTQARTRVEAIRIADEAGWLDEQQDLLPSR